MRFQKYILYGTIFKSQQHSFLKFYKMLRTVILRLRNINISQDNVISHTFLSIPTSVSYAVTCAFGTSNTRFEVRVDQLYYHRAVELHEHVTSHYTNNRSAFKSDNNKKKIFSTMSAQQKNYNINIEDMRIKYKDKNETFTEDHLISKEPIGQFKAWFEEACKCSQILEPNAMFLATATKDGIPSVRAVLLKGFGTEGFKFYTNYNSRKGRELAENPRAALNLYWESLNRSVRIEGIVKKISAEDSDHYFQSRPYASQIGSMASKQSSVIASRQILITKEKELLAQFPEGHVKRADWWGGYLVVPHSMEFWQGQSDRLHDRIRFRRPKADEKIDNILIHEGEHGWVYERLAP